jgi:adenylate cyclase
MKKRDRRRRILAALVIAGVAFAASVLLPFTDVIELKTLDLRFALRGVKEPSAPVVIVSIDDASFMTLERRWPWPREFFAKAIDLISADGARSIGLDVSMSDKGFLPGEDVSLARAMKRSGKVTLPAKFGALRTAGINQTYLDLPNPVFREMYAAAGYVNLFLDRDGFVRRLKLSESFQDSSWFPFALQTLAGAQGASLAVAADGTVAIGDRKIPHLPDGLMLVNFAGPPGTFPAVSFSDVLDGSTPPGFFAGKIVLIGAGYKESHDLFPTPFFPGEGMYGVEIHANVINTLATGGFIRGTSGWQSLVLVLLVSALAAALLVWFRPVAGLGLALLLWGALAAGCILLFTNSGLWVRMVEPLLAVVLCYVGALVYRYALEEREKRQVRAVFSRYVAPSVVEQILKEEKGVALGGETREVTIFFSDIRGFTTLSEKITPEQVVQMLNEYFREMVEIIFQYGGTLNKFIGDAIMAIYGAPLPLADPAEKAVRACLQMRDTLARLNERRQAEGKESLRIGMALHRGTVVVGNIGSPRQMEYTVIGDVVNICSRLEGLTKELATDFIISDEIYRDVHGLVAVESPPPILVKGKTVPLQVHKVLGFAGGST